MNNIPNQIDLNRHCGVCDNAVGRLLYNQNFSQLSDRSGLLTGYDVVVCDECGFCFADHIPGMSVFDKYYRDMSKYEKTEKGESDSAYDQARFQIMAEVILKLIPERNAQVFEVGCANGQLLNLLKKKGFENVGGIDPSATSAQIARQHFGIKVSANTLSDITIADGGIDFLILAGVLEHLPNLATALQKLKNMLSLHGRLFISVPDASRYPEGEDAPFQEFSVEHINFFGPVSLVNLLEANGFELSSLEQGVIGSSYRTTTPVIHAVFKKARFSKPTAIIRDTETEKALRIYIDKSTQEDIQIQKAIESVIQLGGPIIIWGRGAHTLRLLATSNLGNAKIRAFVDSNPRYQGKRIDDVPVISPNSFKDYSEPILISSRVYQEDIALQIVNNLKLENKIIKLYKMD